MGWLNASTGDRVNLHWQAPAGCIDGIAHRAESSTTSEHWQRRQSERQQSALEATGSLRGLDASGLAQRGSRKWQLQAPFHFFTFSLFHFFNFLPPQGRLGRGLGKPKLHMGENLKSNAFLSLY
jgi:hypothetical protein